MYKNPHPNGVVADDCIKKHHHKHNRRRPYRGRVWVNEGEIAGNGIDDDGNGHMVCVWSQTGGVEVEWWQEKNGENGIFMVYYGLLTLWYAMVYSGIFIVIWNYGQSAYLKRTLSKASF